MQSSQSFSGTIINSCGAGIGKLRVNVGQHPDGWCLASCYHQLNSKHGIDFAWPGSN